MDEQKIVNLGKKSYDLSKLSNEQVLQLHDYIDKRTDQINKRLEKIKEEVNEL